ncbi:MAG: crotonase/enoyl-CoA hydratase family protein [Bacteroidota bacterium]
MQYNTFLLSIENQIATVSFNRPNKANALTAESWKEMQQIFESLSENPEVRVVILTGEGRNFCGGIDLSMLMSINQVDIKDNGRRNEAFLKLGTGLQTSVNAIEKCTKPVIAAIQGACVGGGVDIIAACDMRYGTLDSYFSIKEIDLGMVADLGTLQRLPKIINSGIVSELAFTGRKVDGQEAEKIGLISRTYENKDSMMASITEIASTIAGKSPLSVRGIKQMLLYARDHSVDDALKYQMLWNAAMMRSTDLEESFMAHMQKRKPDYEN